MIKFKTFLTEGHDPFHNRSMGIMSAERGDLPPEANAHRTRSLHSDLRAAGHKVIPVTGAYVENMGTPEARETHERSFIVMHNKPGDDNGAVKKTLIHMGKKYGQDSILHKPHNSDIASFHGTNKATGVGKVTPVGKYRPRNNDQMFTRMKSGREFTFGESLNEAYTDQFSKGGWDMYGHAANYAKDNGLPHINPEMQNSTADKQKPIAHAYHVAASGDEDYKKNVFKAYQSQHPDMVKKSGAIDYDSLTKASYGAMERETGKQYDHLSQHVKFDYHGGDKDYKDSNAMRDDLHNNKHMDVFNGGEEHEFLNKKDAGSDVNSNHKFRAVHDAFGHGILKNGFGPKGEETAWHIHSQMYSPLARAAMTSETRGQNSWVNYSGVNAGKSPKDTTYAKQKAVLLPPEMNRPDYDGKVPHYMKKHMETPITESNYRVSQVRESEKMKVRPEHEEENHFVSPAIDKKASDLHKTLSQHYIHTDQDVKGLHAYSVISRDLNHNLRKKQQFGSGWNMEKGQDEAIHHLDSVMDKHKTPQDMHVYSGTKHDLRKHDIMDHPAYMSTSLHPEVAHGFSIQHKSYNHDTKNYESHVMNIHVPKGSRGAYIGHIAKYPGEKEFIIPRDSKLKYNRTESTKYGSTILHEHHVDLIK
jgi:ADP-ribosyltransferase exoenzyme